MSRILGTFPVRDGLVGLWPLFAGTFLDHSGLGHHATPTACAWRRERGLECVDFQPFGRLVVANTATLQAITAGTMAVATPDSFGRHTLLDRFLSKRDAGGTQFDIRWSATNLELHDGSITPYIAFGSREIARSVAMTFGNGAKAVAFRNGARVGELSAANTIAGDDCDLYIGNLYGTTYPNSNPFDLVALWSRVLLDDEVAEVHAWTEAARSAFVDPDRRFFDLGSLAPIFDGSLFSYDARDVVGNVCADRSGNGRAGSLANGLTSRFGEFGQAFKSSGFGEESLAVPAFTGQDDIAIEALLRINSSGGGGSGRVLNGTNQILYFTGSGPFGCSWTLSGVTGSPFNTGPIFPRGEWIHVVWTRRRSDGAVRLYANGEAVLTTAGGVEAWSYSSAPTLFNNLNTGGTRAFDGEVQFVRVLDRYMESAEVARRARLAARKVVFDEDFSRALPTVSNLTSGQIPGTDYAIETGSWKVGEDSGGKWIECVSAGIIWRKNPSPYGTWDFELYYNGGGTTQVAFISDDPFNTTGYEFRLNGDKRAIFYRMNAGAVGTTLYTSVTNYIALATRYKFRITRDVSGVFSLYGFGADPFNNWGYLGEISYGSNPSTDNVVTGSKMFAFHLNAGDRLYLDRQYLGVVSPI